MGSRPNYVKKKFGPLLDKTLENAVAACIGREFPRLGGPRIRELCARMLLDVVDAHRPPRERVAHGQVVWMAVPLDQPPHRYQRIADLPLVPVVLDLAERHFETLHARGLPARQAYVFGGAYLGWLATRDLLAPAFAKEWEREIRALARGRLSGPELYRRTGGALETRMLRPLARRFSAT